MSLAYEPSEVGLLSPATNSSEAPRTHVLTVALEDYFHVGAFRDVIRSEHWARFEPRLVENARRTLDLLDRFAAKATFFVMGWVADNYPEVVAAVAERGHEIASSGYYHRRIRDLTPAEFRADVLRARAAIERVTKREVLGFRIADQWLTQRDLWALEILAEEGFLYDSSLAAWGRAFAAEPWRRFAHRQELAGHTLWELPPATSDWLGWKLPMAGGNYFRQLPQAWHRRALATWHHRHAAPLVLYFHVWELDPEQPRISGASRWARLRHYRNLDKMPGLLADCLGRYRFSTAAEFLNLSAGDVAPRSLAGTAGRPIVSELAPSTPATNPASVVAPTEATIVVPCFNEEASLSYLSNTLERVQAAFGDDFSLRFVLVDDGSADGTWAGLERVFGQHPAVHLVRHERNRGIAAAIRSGIAAAETEIVCSIDCDCSYDPHELRHMIPLLEPGVDLVTASPYHPRGLVRNVAPWRLVLSRGASWLYRRALRQKLYTYTSCCRVYRRSSVLGLPLSEDSFLGIAELVWRLGDRPGAVVEHPATLESRLFGQSKMKVLHTIGGHLQLLRRIATERWRTSRALRQKSVPSTTLTASSSTADFDQAAGQSESHSPHP